MKASKFIAQYLEKQGVITVFEMSGGMITHILDSIYLEGKMRILSNHHEQAAAFAADGFGRMSGVPGVALATSGPGATNLITGIGSCYFDSTPAVFITGQVNTNEQKGSLPIRQLGFQETNITEVVAPLTKKVFVVKNAEEIPNIFQEAFQTALSDRPGPVLIDIPMDLQRADLKEDLIAPFMHKVEVLKTSVKTSDVENFYKKMIEAINKSKNPVILVGGGVRLSRSRDECVRFIEKLGLPVIYTLMAVDVLPQNHPLKVGMLGSYGNRWANLAIAESDFVLVLGSRLDIRQTGGNIDSFKEGRIFFHIDCDSGELNNRIKGCTTLQTDLYDFFKYSELTKDAVNNKGLSSWIARINDLKRQYSDIDELKDCPGINPNIFMHQLSKFAQKIKAYIVDVGQHQMWAAQSLDLKEGQRFLTSGGMGAMGFSLPAAIGATLSVKETLPALVIAGDGAFQVNIQELETIKHNKLPIKIIVLNNQSHGMVRQFQESYFENRFQSTVWGYSAPSFQKVAEAYGIESKSIAKPEEVEFALSWLTKDLKKSSLLEVAIDPSLNVYPKLAFGKKFGEMEPQAKPLDMEGT